MKRLVVIIILATFNALSLAQEPPKQAESGPGGTEYKHDEVKSSKYGKDELEYWLFEPAKPAPKSAPVVVFNHGWGGMNPCVYGAWIKHIVRRGNIVIYPRYQTRFIYPPEKITPNAIQAVKDAIKELQSDRHVRPELDKFAAVGHSAGGQITANMATLAAEEKLPTPEAIMCVQPGKSWSLLDTLVIPLEDMGKIPKGTLLLTVAGDEDTLVRDIDAKRIFKESTQVSNEDKDFVLVITDDYGKPVLSAGHFSPCATYDIVDLIGKANEDTPAIERAVHTVNAIDYYGYWKLFDGLCDAAFYNKNREYALGGTPQQKFMGKWSNGTPVKELAITDKP